MNGRLSVAIVCLAVALAAPVARGAAVEQSLEHGGLTRTYRLHVPASRDQSRPLPLLLALHGGGGTGRYTERMTGFDDLADQKGFVAVYPDGVDRGWYDGRAIPGRRPQDDVGFLTALVDHLSGTLPIDRRRVYAAGISNGAMMSYRLACDRAEVFAAIGPVAGAMPEVVAPRCAPAQPVSVVAINGTEDPLVPWAGGVVARDRGRVLSVPDSIALWARLDGCPAGARVVQEPDRDPRDGTRVRRETRGPCRGGTEVVLYAVEGGGHTWPGATRSRIPFTGRLSRDLDATAAIWSFFEQHPKPAR